MIVCAALKDNGITIPTAHPSRHKMINDFERYGNELIEEQKVEKDGPLMINYDCKECDHLQTNGKTKHHNTVSVVSHPNKGHDAIVGHQIVKAIKPPMAMSKHMAQVHEKRADKDREDGHTGEEVGAAVWEIIEPFIKISMHKNLLININL